MSLIKLPVYTCFGCIILLASCAYPKNFTRDFYMANEISLRSLKDQYRQLYKKRPFALLFENKNFDRVALEIIYPDIKYVYHFNINDRSFADTLARHSFNIPKMLQLINGLKQIGCTWVDQLDFYEGGIKKHLVLMAVRNKALNSAFKGESYCLLTFFDSPQIYDAKGRILDKQEKRIKKQINGYHLYRVNDSVAYSIAKQYR